MACCVGIGKTTTKIHLKLEEWDMRDLDYLPEPELKKYDTLWTKDIDETLLRYWPIKQKNQLAKAMGIGVKHLRRRYIELTKPKE
jgi:hypothetical protein